MPEHLRELFVENLPIERERWAQKHPLPENATRSSLEKGIQETKFLLWSYDRYFSAAKQHFPLTPPW